MSSEIIRCIDCESYKKPKGAKCGFCEHGFLEVDITDDDFCSRAEKRNPGTSMFVEPEVKIRAKKKSKDSVLKADFMTCGSPTTNVTSTSPLRDLSIRLNYDTSPFTRLAEAAVTTAYSYEEAVNAWRDRLAPSWTIDEIDAYNSSFEEADH